jgi:Holliday junction resolvase-like predicted endonuclease
MSSPNPTAIGHEAEQAACQHLQRLGFEIEDRNWRTKYCEIDIVARKDGCLHFIEVKYRHADAQGSGLDYITAAKIKRMHFAAELWVNRHDWLGEINLAAIEVCAPDYAIGDFIESVF